MSFRGRGAIEMVEQVYAPAATDEAWLRGLGEAAARVLGTGLPVEASIHTPRPGDPFRTRARVFTTDDDALVAMYLELYDQPQRSADDSHLVAERFQNRCRTASEWMRDNNLPLSLMRTAGAKIREAYGVADSLNLQGCDPSGESILLSIMLPEETSLHPRTRTALLRVAAHLGAAARLRRALAEADVTLADTAAIMAGAEAVIDASGNVIEASGPAKSPRARERLRGAALAIDKARGRLARERPEEAIELWQGLVAGRWSIIEVTDTDARRYWVAQRNDPTIAEDRRLTRREGQVVGMAALGLSDEMVAYSLGLAETTVRTHLRRGMKKLGMSQRTELIALHAALVG
ncbi:MAG TPA: helix-turn-helix transcriptional regulator [Kofleriaceae bacterium]|nr:helix-turn-helix transcriptional regulator [Kofleriaceae bacterium]